MDVLILCTANVCRSPLAEALLAAQLAQRGIQDVRVSSAGFLSPGRPPSEEVYRVLEERGVDASALTSSTQVDEDLVRSADLVLTMTRQQLREAVVLAPERFGRTFTLKDLVRRSLEHGPRHPDEPIGAWLERLGADRRPSAILRDDPDDEVADPVGRPLRVFRRTAVELDDLLGTLVAQAWAPGASRAQEATG